MATVSSINPLAERIEKFFSVLIPSDAQLEEISQRAAVDLEKRPQFYFLKSLLMAVAGYSYIFAVVGILIGILLALVFYVFNHHGVGAYAIGKLSLLLIVLIFAIGKALWIKSSPPDGVPLTREEAPVLFDTVEDYKKALNTRVDEVKIDDSFNAFVMQVPRLGILGFHKNYLVLGLPLMASMTADQFKGVLAHELGHLSGNHGKSKAWIYGLRVRWSNLFGNLRESSPLAYGIFYGFFAFLAPRFNAYTMALARTHELEADADADRIAGSGNLGAALVTLELKGNDINEHFWPGIFLKPLETEKPIAGVYSFVSDHVRKLDVPGEVSARWLEQALKAEGKWDDTHPCLRKRLEALGCLSKYIEHPQKAIDELSSPLPRGESAAEVLLGDYCSKISDCLSEVWQASLEEYWQVRHESLKASLERREKLNEKAASEELSAEETLEFIYHTSEVEGHEAAKPLWEKMVEKFPDDPVANYSVGLIRLGEKDEAGIPYLEKAMSLRVSMVGDCCTAIKNYLTDAGRGNEALKYDGKLKQFERECGLASKERENVTPGDELIEYQLSEEYKDYIGEVLKHFHQIKRAYIAEKVVEFMPEYKFLVLGLESGAMKNQEEVNEIAVFLLANLQLPEQFCVVTFDMYNKKLKDKITSMPDSLVYET
ncbi:MAG: M48 family metallopeptidase [Candidatus Obscuribacterales bacterium]